MTRVITPEALHMKKNGKSNPQEIIQSKFKIKISIKRMMVKIQIKINLRATKNFKLRVKLKGIITLTK